MSKKLKTKRGPKERMRGRELGGQACLGCIEFTQQPNSAGHFIGRGWCATRERVVASNDRRPCGLYLFHPDRQP